MTVIRLNGGDLNEPYKIYTANRMISVGDKFYKDPVIMTGPHLGRTYRRDRLAWFRADWRNAVAAWDDLHFMICQRDVTFLLTAMDRWPSALTPPLAP